MAKKKTKVEAKVSTVPAWVEPYPTGGMVRAMLNQDVILNGKMMKAGEHVIPADFAHSHANILSAPK